MFRFAPYVLKSLWRHRARTLLTAAGVAVALFVFAAVEAARAGLADLAADGRSARTLIVFQANRFCPSTSRLPEEYAARLRKLPGVADVVPVLVFLNNCRASLDLVMFHGVPPEALRSARELRMEAGDVAALDGQADAALVGRALARRRNLSVGDRFTVGEVSVAISGVFTAPTPAEENVLYTRLDYLQRARGLAGRVTQFEVRLRDGADPAAVARAIDEAFHDGPAATDTRTKGAFQAGAVGDLAELIGWAGYLGYACVGLVLALVATTMVMAVEDRAREHAVLQALGVSGARLFRLVLAQSALIALIGGAVGVGAAQAVLAWGQFALGTEGVTIALTPDVAALGRGLAVALAVGAAAGAAPAWRAARAEVVTALREA